METKKITYFRSFKYLKYFKRGVFQIRKTFSQRDKETGTFSRTPLRQRGQPVTIRKHKQSSFIDKSVYENKNKLTIKSLKHRSFLARIVFPLAFPVAVRFTHPLPTFVLIVNT